MALCCEPNCKTRAVFNYKDNKKGIYCSKHKNDNMINVKDIYKRCKSDNCKIIAVYNYSTEQTPIYCVKHKLINL